MKNIFKIITILGAFTFTFSCDKSPDNAVYDLIDFESGAVLRTISIENNLLNSSIPSTAFVVIVEEQDEQDGGLMESVDVYVTINDRTPDNGTTPPSEALVKNIPASAFITGPVGLPRTTISVTFGEAVDAMGLSPDDYSPGDVFVFELRLNLTDGRIFGAKSSSTVLTGIFFNAPHKYNTLIVCSPAPGDYRVEMHDSYGDGWQTDCGNGGSGIKVDIDGTIVEVGMCSPYGGCNIGSFLDQSQGGCTPNSGSNATATVTIPVGTEGASWTFPGDWFGEISFEVFAPDGSLVFESGGPGDTGAGLLPIVVCAQ